MKQSIRFNLLDEQWIPTDLGHLSLLDFFKKSHMIKSLTGIAIENFALINLFRAITEDAVQPYNDGEWIQQRYNYTTSVIEYLQKRYDDFWLYHPTKPFLQDAKLDSNDVFAQQNQKLADKLASAEYIARAAEDELKNIDENTDKKIFDAKTKYANECRENVNKIKQRLSKKEEKNKHATSEDACFHVSALDFLQPQESMATAFSMQPRTDYSDAEIVLNLITHQTFYTISNGRKRTHLSVGIDTKGLMHAMFCGETLQETIWLNIIPVDEMAKSDNPTFVQGKLCLTWTEFIKQNDKKIAHTNVLVPFSRRVRLLDSNTFLMAEGVSYKENPLDTATVIPIVGKQLSENDIQYLKPKIGMRGYRYLDAFFRFLDVQENKYGCALLRLNSSRVMHSVHSTNSIGIRCTGVAIDYKSGSHAFNESTKIIESIVSVDASFLDEYQSFTDMMAVFRNIDDMISFAVCKYHLTMKSLNSLKSSDIDKSTARNNIIECSNKWWLYVDSCLYKKLWTEISNTLNNQFVTRDQEKICVANIIETMVKSVKPVIRQILNESLPAISAKQLEAISLAEYCVNRFTTIKKD